MRLVVLCTVQSMARHPHRSTILILDIVPINSIALPIALLSSLPIQSKNITYCIPGTVFLAILELFKQY